MPSWENYRDIAVATKIFEKYNPTFVIHLAAKVGGLYANSASPVDFLRDNLAIDQNVLKLAHDFKVGSPSAPCVQHLSFVPGEENGIDSFHLHFS